MEMKVVHVGDTTVEVEYDPDDFKGNAIVWRALIVTGMVFAYFGPLLVALAATLVGLALLAGTWAAQRGRQEQAIREAAWKSMYRYEDQRIVQYKGMG